MELNLNGKVVVVTGGSSGIGEETAMEFAREGCEVTIASRMLTGDQISAPVTLFSKLLKSGPPGKSRLCLPPYRLVL